MSRLCYCASFHSADPKPTSRCRTCSAYTDEECQEIAAVLKEAGYPRAPESIARATSLIVGKHPKTEQGNVAMDADDSRWTTASNGSYPPSPPSTTTTNNNNNNNQKER